MASVGELLLPQIHFLIDQAEFVIAEMSENNAKVFYEAGYAKGNGKQIVPLIEHGSEIDRNMPSNLRGYFFLKHRGRVDKAATEAFDHELPQDLRHRGNHKLELLRDFLLGAKPTPAYIVASPRVPQSQGIADNLSTATGRSHVQR